MNNCHEQQLIYCISFREPQGFGFVQFVYSEDAAEATYLMDGQILLGRELTVVFAEEKRKKPSEMRARERSRGASYDRKRSQSCYSRSPRRGRSYSQSPDYYSSWRRHYSRSVSPGDRRYSEQSYSRSPSPYYRRNRSRSWSSRSRS
uniref:RRM domain-containing protein n=1 Tax=Kalanchoe fedtschenkoi TaxID=63787 RepID=A0A7N0TD34_KALFE